MAMGPGEALAIIAVSVSAATTLILRGPLGKALADRASGKAGEPDSVTLGEIDRLRHELDDVTRRLAEAEDRLDFTERLLAQQRQQSALGSGQ